MLRASHRCVVLAFCVHHLSSLPHSSGLFFVACALSQATRSFLTVMPCLSRPSVFLSYLLHHPLLLFTRSLSFQPATTTAESSYHSRSSSNFGVNLCRLTTTHPPFYAHFLVFGYQNVGNQTSYTHFYGTEDCRCHRCNSRYL